jgi:hypothetical protein
MKRPPELERPLGSDAWLLGAGLSVVSRLLPGACFPKLQCGVLVLFQPVTCSRVMVGKATLPVSSPQPNYCRSGHRLQRME